MDNKTNFEYNAKLNKHVNNDIDKKENLKDISKRIIGRESLSEEMAEYLKLESEQTLKLVEELQKSKLKGV